MMLRYSLDKDAAADAIENAVQEALKSGARTADLIPDEKQRAASIRCLNTSEMGDLIASLIK